MQVLLLNNEDGVDSVVLIADEVDAEAARKIVEASCNTLYYGVTVAQLVVANPYEEGFQTVKSADPLGSLVEIEEKFPDWDAIEFRNAETANATLRQRFDAAVAAGRSDEALTLATQLLKG